MFNSLFNNAATGLDIKTALICAGVSLLLGIAIAITHMKTTQTTKGFLITLAVLPLLVMAVMIMINWMSISSCGRRKSPWLSGCSLSSGYPRQSPKARSCLP